MNKTPNIQSEADDSLTTFLDSWALNSEQYNRAGDYVWMAAQLPTGRVLDIGCGLGFGTAALMQKGCELLAVDNIPQCISITEERLSALPGEFQLLTADVEKLSSADRAIIDKFAPEIMTCWLMGVPSDVTQEGDLLTVSDYRIRLHRQAVKLAASLSSVHTVHFVDRTIIPWQGKTLARDTLLALHKHNSLRDLPFTASIADALYRKLNDPDYNSKIDRLRHLRHKMQSLTPVLASLVAHRHG